VSDRRGDPDPQLPGDHLQQLERGQEYGRALLATDPPPIRRGRSRPPFLDRAKRAWATTNEREVELAEREGRKPDLLQPITLHECRHTFASLLIDAGVNPKAIQEFMGHATIEETFSRYGHLMPGTRNQARELVDAYMDARGVSRDRGS
jgi:integrase